MELRKEIEITPIGKLNRLEVEVEHDKGGYNFYDGSTRRKGIICRVRPLSRIGGLNSIIIDGKTEHMGFYVFLVPCDRKSPKKLEKVADVILPMTEKIGEMFVKGEYRAIADMMLSAVGELNL